MRESIYPAKVQKQIDKLQKEISVLEQQTHAKTKQIQELSVGQSPIQPGDLIEWLSHPKAEGTKTLMGRVIKVTPLWDRYEYRCHIVSKKNGKPLGFANVDESRCPKLVSK